jgi:hypothetical protein
MHWAIRPLVHRAIRPLMHWAIRSLMRWTSFVGAVVSALCGFDGIPTRFRDFLALVSEALLSGPAIVGFRTQGLQICLAIFQQRLPPATPRIFSELSHLLSLLGSQQCVDLEHRAEPVPLHLDLGRSDGVDLLHHGGFIGSVLREKRLHPLMQFAKLGVELISLVFRFLDDAPNCAERLFIEIQRFGVFLDEGSGIAMGIPRLEGRSSETHSGECQRGHQCAKESNKLKSMHLFVPLCRSEL